MILILTFKHIPTELKDRTDLITTILNSRDNTAFIKQAMNDFFKYQEWMNNDDAITLLSNSIRKENLYDVTPLIMMLIRKYKKLNKQSLTKQRKLATLGINYFLNFVGSDRNYDEKGYGCAINGNVKCHGLSNYHPGNCSKFSNWKAHADWPITFHWRS